MTAQPGKTARRMDQISPDTLNTMDSDQQNTSVNNPTVRQCQPIVFPVNPVKNASGLSTLEAVLVTFLGEVD